MDDSDNFGGRSQRPARDDDGVLDAARITSAQARRRPGQEGTVL
jgi:hypothetical protein